MIHINGIFFLLIAPALIGLVILFVIFILKVKWGWLWLVTGYFILAGSYYACYQLMNQEFYQFQTELYNCYPEIEEVDFSHRDGRQHYRIYILMGKEIDTDQMEGMFLDIMKRINEEPFSEYLRDRDNTDWLSIDVCFSGIPEGTFSSGSYQRQEWFSKEQQRAQVWENRALHKRYQYHDYAP